MSAALGESFVPATTVQEPPFVIELPWLAYRGDGHACGTDEWPDLGKERQEGCYTVPDVDFGTLVWELTQAIRGSDDERYELKYEFSVEEDEQTQVFQFWWDKFAGNRELAIIYVLDIDNPRFHVRYEWPRSESE